MNEQLAAIKARREAITPGVARTQVRKATAYNDNDAAFIAAAPADVDTLLAMVERLQAQLAAVPVDAIRLLLWGDATQPGYVDAVGTVGNWLVEEQEAANAAAELRAPTYGGGCW